MKYELSPSWFGENIPDLSELRDLCTLDDSTDYCEDDRTSSHV